MKAIYRIALIGAFFFSDFDFSNYKINFFGDKNKEVVPYMF